MTLFIAMVAATTASLSGAAAGGSPAGASTMAAPGELHIVRVDSLAALRRAAAAAQPGTAVLLEPGRYSGRVNLADVAGWEGAPIVIGGADADDPPVIDGGGEAMHLSNCRYVTLRNLVVTDCRHNGINIDDGGDYDTPTHHVTVERVTIRGVGPKGNFDALKLSGLDDFVVRDCRFEGWGGSAIDMVGCHRGVVSDCTFLGREGYSQHSGIQIKGGSADVLVRGSFFKDAGQRAINIGGSTGLEYFRPRPEGFESRGVEVAGNRFVGSTSPINWVTSDGGHVHHNTIYLPDRWVMRILQEQPVDRFSPCRDGVFEHNLVVFGRLHRFVNVGPHTAADTFVFRNNAWFDTLGDRKPQLPTREKGGVYGVDPKLDHPGEPGMRITSTDSRLRDVGARACERARAESRPAAAAGADRPTPRARKNDEP